MSWFLYCCHRFYCYFRCGCYCCYYSCGEVVGGVDKAIFMSTRTTVYDEVLLWLSWFCDNSVYIIPDNELGGSPIGCLGSAIPPL